MPGLTYRQVKDIYDQLHGAGAVTKTLPDWSTEMNNLSATDLYSAGLHDNLIKRGSVGIDRMLESAGIPQAGESFGRGVGEAVGDPEAGARVGHGLGRGVVNFLPLLIPGAGEVQAANLARLGATALLSGGETYTETGSPAAGVLGGVTNAAMPGVAGAAEGLVKNRVGSFLAGQGAAAGLGEISGYGQDLLAGRDLHNPFSVETLLNLTLGQAPFAAIHLGTKGVEKAFAPSPEEAAMKAATAAQQQKALDEARDQQDGVLDKLQFPSANPKQVEETSFLLAKLRKEKAALAEEATPESMAEWDRKSKEESDLVGQQQGLTQGVGTLGGEITGPNAPRTNIVGTEHFANDGSRIIRVADDPNNIDQGLTPGELIRYSRAYEPAPTPDQLNPAQQVFSVPTGFMTRGVVDRFAEEKAKVQEQQQAQFEQKNPELPQQQAPLDIVKFRADHADLQDLQTKLDTATTDEDLRSVIVDYNNKRAELGIPPLDDAAIKRLQDNQQVDATAAVRGQITATMKRIEAREQVRAQEQQRADEVTGALLAPREQALKEGEVRDEKAVALANELNAVRDVGGFDQSRFNRAVYDWNLAGQPGGVEGLVNKMKEGKRTGKGKRKEQVPEDKTVQKVEEVVKDKTPDTYPLKQIQEAIIDSVTSTAETESEANDAVLWRRLMIEGDPIPKDLASHPHVEEWTERYQELMRKAVANNSISRSLDERPFGRVPNSLMGFPRKGPTKPYEEQGWKFEQPVKVTFEDGTSIVDKVKGLNEAHALERAQRNWPTAKIELATEQEFKDTEVSRSEEGGPSTTTLSEFRPFKPQTPEDVATIKDWGIGQDGTGLANFLSRSVDPIYSGLGKALLQFPELLKRITAEVWNMPGSRAFRTKDGRTGLLFDSALLRADPETQERNLAHELLHGLTKVEVDNPTNQAFADTLTKFREKLIDALPKDQRVAFDQALASGFRERWAQGLADPTELHIDPRVRRVLYGLLDNHELISQGFTTEEMRKFMQKVPGEKGKSMWNSFTGWVRELLGLGEKVGETAFDEFLTHSSNVLQQGEFAATARNYMERFFENKGLEPDQVTEQTQRALALVLDGGSKESLVERAVGRGAPQTARFKQLEQAVNKLQDPTFQGVLAELGYGANSKGLDGLTTDILNGNHGDPEAVMALLPEAASQYVFERVRDAKDVLDGAAGAVKNAGAVGVEKSVGDLKGAVGETQKLLALEQHHQKAKTDILGMSGLGADGLVSRALTEPEKLKEVADPFAPKPGFLSWIERLLSPAAQVARQDPRFAEHFAKTTQQAGNARKMRDDALEALATDSIPETLAQLKEHGVVVDPSQIGANLSEESQKRSEKVVTNPKLTKAADVWNFLNQKKNRGKEVVLPADDPDVAKALAGLSTEDKAIVSEFIQKLSVGTQRMHAKQIGVMKEIAATQGVKLLGRELAEFGAAVPWNERLKIASVALDAGLTDFSDPVKAASAQATLTQLQSQLPPPVFIELMKHVTNARDRIQTWEQHFAERPAWISGKDYGRYRAIWVDKAGKVHRVSGDDLKYVQDTARQGTVKEFQDRGDQQDVPVDYGGLTPGVFNRLQELERNSWDILGLTPDQRAEAARSAGIATQLAREANAQGIPDIPNQGRRLSRGAEDVPWTSNFFSYMSATSNYWTRKLLREQHDALMAEPETQKDPSFSKFVQEYYDGYMAPDPKVAQQIKRVMSTWFLGANIASALANPVGNAMRMISELTAVSGKPLQSYERYLGAAKDVLKNFRGKEGWKNPQETELLEEAARRGFRDYNLHDDNAIAQDTLATRYKQLIDQQRPQSVGKRLGTVAGNLGNASMWMFRMGDRYSSTLAILAGYRLYREQGLGHTEAMEKAFEFSHSVNDSGGRANRPVGPFSAQGELPRSAALLGTTLQNFVLGSTFQLVRYLKQGKFRPGGLTPHEVYSARKAAIQMLSMQFAAAGALGMPFVSGALALLDKEFPELELNRKLRETSKEFFDGDQSQGSTLSDMAMTGVPSMLGWDLQSRLSMGNTIPGVSEVNGFQPEALFGPGASLVSQFVKGSQRLSQGQGRPSDFAPPAVKKLIDLVSSGGVSRDYKGRPVLNDLTPGEKLGVGLGFQPKRLSDFNAAQRVTEQADTVNRLQEGQFRQQLAEEVLKGSFGTVRQALLQRSNADQTFDPIEAVRAIAQKAEDQVFPRDLRREGTPGNSTPRGQLLAAFQLDASKSTELSRLQFRQQIEQRLGLQVSRSSDLVKAQLMDKLRATRPDATRSELRWAAEAALVRSARQTSLLPQEGQ